MLFRLKSTYCCREYVDFSSVHSFTYVFLYHKSSCDISYATYAAVQISDNDKEYRLGKKLTMMCIGEEGDVAQFGDWTKRNIRLYAIRNGNEFEG